MRIIRIPLAQIHAAAAERPRGYVQTALSAGWLEGEELVLSEDAWLKLANRFRPPNVEWLGDRVERWASPVKMWLQRRGWWPAECGCDRRRLWLNRWHRRISRL